MMTAPAPEKAAPIPAEVQPTDAMIEAAAKAIHDHWQNGPGPHARTWEKCCRDFPGAADDFRAKARVGLVAAIIQDRADRASQEERIREDEREAIVDLIASWPEIGGYTGDLRQSILSTVLDRDADIIQAIRERGVA